MSTIGGVKLTLEEVTVRHERALGILQAEPSARRYVDLRKEWSKMDADVQRADAQLERLKAKERNKLAEVMKAKAELSDAAREALT